MTKSNLVQAIEKWTSDRLVVVRGAENVFKKLDSEYELLDEKTLLRKNTQQTIEFNDALIKTFLKPYVQDRSFGSFRSRFTPGAPDENMRGKVQSLIESTGIAFYNKERADKLSGFIRSNFVVDGSKLRKLNDGIPSKNAWSPEELLLHYDRENIDQETSELTRLEQAAAIREKARYLAPDPKAVDRIEAMLTKRSTVSFEPMPESVLSEVDADNKARAMAYLNILSERDMTVADQNAVGVQAKFFEAAQNQLPQWQPDQPQQ